MTRVQLDSVRNTSRFTCPQCGNPLILKIGKVVTPHFAHIVLSNCITSFSERESPTHLLGKQHLAEFFTRIGCEVSVEAYLPEIAQRPDLLVRKGKHLFAVEFQCSVISIQDVVKRNNGYRKIEIFPIWLLGTPKNMKVSTSGISYLKLSKFMQSFMIRDSLYGLSLITYDPISEHFVYYTHLLHIGGISYVAKVRSLSLEYQTYPFAQVRSLTYEEIKGYWRIFQQKRAKYLKNRIFSSKFGARDKFLRNCYEHLIRPENLPLYVGFPVQGSESIQEHLIVWQLALLCALNRNKIEPKQVSKEWIEAFLETQCKVLHDERAIKTVKRYCQLLIDLDYNLNLPILEQQFNESKILDQFDDVLVAKRCEN